MEATSSREEEVSSREAACWEALSASCWLEEDAWKEVAKSFSAASVKERMTLWIGVLRDREKNKAKGMMRIMQMK